MLALVSGSLALEQFQILETGTLQAAGLSAECRIVGSSHVILYQVNGRPLWEVFACQEVNETAQRFPLASLADLDLEFTHPGNADFVFQAWTAPLNDSRWALRRLRVMPLYLEYEFPSGGEGSQPLTIVSGDETQNGLTIETAHSYPNHDRVVFTRSHLSRRR